MTEREKFEKHWCRDVPEMYDRSALAAIKADRYMDKYRREEIQWAWEAWQAARAVDLAELTALRTERDALREQRRNEEPQAWLHTMHMEGDQTYEKLTFDEENAFGSPGKDYSADYLVTIEPLYLHSAALDRIDKLGEKDV